MLLIIVEETQKKAKEGLNNLVAYEKWVWVSVIFKLRKHLKI